MKTLKELLADVLGVDKEEINDESSPDSISSWDSFNGLMLVSELENAQLNVQKLERGSKEQAEALERVTQLQVRLEKQKAAYPLPFRYWASSSAVLWIVLVLIIYLLLFYHERSGAGP